MSARPWTTTAATVILGLLVAAFVGGTIYFIVNPLARGGRQGPFVLLGLLVLVIAPLVLVVWRKRAPSGPLGRMPGWAFAIVVLLATPLTCFFPYPALYFHVIDPIANDRELALDRRELEPLVADIREEARRRGRLPDTIAPLLNRRFPEPAGAGPRPLHGAIYYHRSGDRFVLVVRATPQDHDHDASVVYRSRPGTWAFEERQYGDIVAAEAQAGEQSEVSFCASHVDGWDCQPHR